MSAVIFGAGLVAHEFHDEFSRIGLESKMHSSNECDIRIPHTVSNCVSDLLNRSGPRIVVNAAGYTDVDGAEVNKDLAMAVNGMGARNVAYVAMSAGATFVHISTDAVFGVGASGLNEFASPGPISAYGASKYIGEQLVAREAALLRRWYILRTGNIYGRHGRNHASRFATQKLEAGYKVNSSRRIAPTPGKLVAEVAWRLIAQDQPSGIYHVMCSGWTNWYTFARIAQERLDGGPVEPSDGEYGVAKRVMDSTLVSAFLPLMGIIVPHWEAALEEFLEEGS